MDADGDKDGLDLNAKLFAISCVLSVVLPAVIHDDGRRVVDVTLYLQGVVDLHRCLLSDSGGWPHSI